MKIYGRRQSHLFAAAVKTALKIIFSIAVLALQIALYYLMFVKAMAYAQVRIVLEIMGLIIVMTLYNRDMNAGHKLSWIIVILIIPMAGTLLYLLFGNGRNVPRRRTKKMPESFSYNQSEEQDCKDEIADSRGKMLAHLVSRNSGMPVYGKTETRFFSDVADKHAALLADIERAGKYIFIEYFIVSDGYVLESLMEALERKGKEGVKIYFIYDDIGSKVAFKRRTKKRLAAIPNLELCVYEPTGIVINPRINYRDHRKIAVIDGKIGYLGGDNLADEYVNKKIRFGHWRDNAMRFEGDAVYSISVLFARTWLMSCGEELDIAKEESAVEKGNGFVQPFGDGPTYTDHPGYGLFKALASSAQKYLYISTPYFIIDDAFINAIALACKQGVDVRLLVPKIPDKKLIFAMTRAHYGAILKAGGKIYEYTPGFNHAKNVIVDDKYAFIGTINCDYRSMLLHFECGALLVGNGEIPKMREDFLAAVEKSEEVRYEQWRKRPLVTKLTELLLSLISPML